VEAEEAAVYAAVLLHGRGEVQDRMAVLSDHTTLGVSSDFSAELAHLEDTLEYISDDLPPIDPTTLDSFRARNDRSYPLSPDMPLPIPYVLISPGEVTAIFAGGEVDGLDGWERFYQRYPTSGGIIDLSRVGFNAEMTQALVYYGAQSHWLDGGGFYFLLSKEGGTWKVVGQAMTWIS
jgi:hypothetical protein